MSWELGVDRRELLDRHWTLRSDDSALIAEGLALLEDGSVSGGLGTDFPAWDLIDGNLCFLNLDFYCTYRFNTMTRRDDGALEFAGRFTLDIENVRCVTLSEDCAPLPDIMAKFETLGDGCEFGVAQRYYGVEPLDLFRFAGLSAPNLLRALTDRLAAFDEPDAVTLTLKDGKNYHADVKAYGMNFHTFRDSGKMTAGQVQTLVRKKLLFTRRKFLEDLEEGNRLYVRKRAPIETLEQIIPIYELLQSFGRRTLLWVTFADDQHPDGTVERIRDELYRGHVERFANGPLFAYRVNAASWAKLCRNVMLGGSAPTLAAPASSQARPKPMMRWTAKLQTYIKSSTENSSDLKSDDKVLAKEGETVEAELSGHVFDHIQLRRVRLNDIALPDRDWYLWAPSWRRL